MNQTSKVKRKTYLPKDPAAEESLLLLVKNSPKLDDETIIEDDNPSKFITLPASEDLDNFNDSPEPDKIDKAITTCLNNIPDLNATLRDKLDQLLQNYKDIFAVDCTGLTQTHLVQCEIDTGDAKPIQLRPYSLAHSERDFVREEIQKMVDEGLLVPSRSPWAFPIVIVKKKTEDKRLCVDFRRLNAITKWDAYPLPNIVDLLESFNGARVFSALDLLKAFNQIQMHPNSIDKVTLTSPYGTYSYVMMPFGIVNGPAVFSRAAALAFKPFIDKFVSVYIDDITVYSVDMDTHLDHLRQVFERCREVRLKFRPDKCLIFRKEVEVLGFIVDKNGIRTNPRKVDKIANFPTPRNPTDIRAFVNLVGFYRRHIQSFSDIAAPLNELLKKRATWNWT